MNVTLGTGNFCKRHNLDLIDLEIFTKTIKSVNQRISIYFYYYLYYLKKESDASSYTHHHVIKILLI